MPELILILALAARRIEDEAFVGFVAPFCWLCFSFAVSLFSLFSLSSFLLVCLKQCHSFYPIFSSFQEPRSLQELSLVSSSIHSLLRVD